MLPPLGVLSCLRPRGVLLIWYGKSVCMFVLDRQCLLSPILMLRQVCMKHVLALNVCFEMNELSWTEKEEEPISI